MAKKMVLKAQNCLKIKNKTKFIYHQLKNINKHVFSNTIQNFFGYLYLPITFLHNIHEIYVKCSIIQTLLTLSQFYKLYCAVLSPIYLGYGRMGHNFQNFRLGRAI